MAMKKLNYTLTVYFNTGFNGIDIPRTSAVLESANKRTYSDVYYLREDLDLPQIQVNDNYHNLADVDYVKLTSNDTGSPSYYYFAVPHAMAGGTTMLALELDALTTMGGASTLDYISGWQERGHIAKSEDVLFGNVAPEDWSPSQPLANTQFEYVDTDTGVTGVTHPTDDLQIIITNIDLVALGKYIESGVPKNIIEVIKGGTLDPSITDPTQQQLLEELMYLPKIASCKDYTTFNIMAGTYEGTSATETASLHIPNTCAFDVTNSIVRNGLDLLFSCGQLQLQGSYTIPKEYVIASLSGRPVTNVRADGRYVDITGNLSFATITNLPFEYSISGYTPKNKKVFAMFRNVTLTNPASGSMVTLPVYELKNGNSVAPVVKSWSDPTSTGKPTAKFETDLSANVPFSDTVSGSNWINNQLLMEGASGSLWNNVNASLNQQTAERNFDKEMYGAQMAVANLGLQGSAMDLQQEAEREQFALKSGMSVVGLVAGMFGGGNLGKGVAGLSSSSLLTAPMSQELMYANQAIAQQQLKNQQEQVMQNARFSADAYKQTVNENRIGLLKSNGVVSPTPYFTPEPNLAMYGYNKFVIYETKMQDNDLESLDDYFQRYGYNGIHRKLDANCFTCRQYYTYVQAFDINIKAVGSYGMRIRNKAISQLNGGVRVWAVLPDASYYETN